jgi:ABC-2 type transport system permease protein
VPASSSTSSKSRHGGEAVAAVGSTGPVARSATDRLVANARVVAALGRRSVVQAFRRPQFLTPILVFPSLFLAVNTGGAGRAVDIPGFPEVHGFLDFQLAGAMLQSTMLAGVSGAIALALDIEIGFMDRLVAAPISRAALVLGRLMATGALGVVSGTWFVLVGIVFGARIEAGVPGALVVIALVGLNAIAFGTLGAALALKSGSASVAQGIFPIVFVILFLSSAWFPQNLLLEPAKSVADWNPMSLIADGLRAPVIYGLSLEDTLKGLAGIAIVAAIGAALSAAALRSRLRSG